MTNEVGAIFLLEMFEPLDGVGRKVTQVLFDFANLLLGLQDVFFGLLAVELVDSCHLDILQAQQVIASHFAHEVLLEGFETQVDISEGRIEVLGLLVLLSLVDALLDEDLFERTGHQVFQQFSLADLEFLTQQFLGIFGRTTQYFAHGEEVRLLVVDDAAVGRNGDLAVGESVKCIDGLVARHTRHQMDDNLGMVAGEVVETLDLDLALFDGFAYRLDERIGGFAKRNIGDAQRLLVNLVDAATHLHDAASCSIVIFRNVDKTTCREVGVKFERFALEAGNRSIEKFVKVVGQDLRRKTYGNTLHALGEEQRELDGQVDRFLLATIVGKLPRGNLIVEHHLERKFRKARLDVTGCSCRITCEDIAPVALAVDEQFLLSQLH